MELRRAERAQTESKAGSGRREGEFRKWLADRRRTGLQNLYYNSVQLLQLQCQIIIIRPKENKLATFLIIDEFLFSHFSTVCVEYLPIQAFAIPLIMKIIGRIIASLLFAWSLDGHHDVINRHWLSHLKSLTKSSTMQQWFYTHYHQSTDGGDNKQRY